MGHELDFWPVGAVTGAYTLGYATIVGLMLCSVPGCRGGDEYVGAWGNTVVGESDDSSVNSHDKNVIEALARMRVFFGHQSVGDNLLDGLSRLASRGGQVDLRIVRLGAPHQAGETVLQHAQIGRNGDPIGKVDHFVALIDSLGDTPPDVALMKFCYMDFTADTDVVALASYYREAIAGLKTRHPEITFAHVTVPLTQREGAVMRLMKRAIGRGNSDLSNVRRQQFNHRLLQIFDSDPVFDLARVESTRRDGSRVSFKYEGGSYFALNPDYTDDGAHLNELGRTVAAAELARVIAEAASQESQMR